MRRFCANGGIETTGAVAALTGIDEENVLIGMYIRKTWPKVKVITKVNRTSFQSIIDSMDLGSVFNPAKLRVEPHLPLCPHHAEFRQQLADRNTLQACRR